MNKYIRQKQRRDQRRERWAKREDRIYEKLGKIFKGKFGERFREDPQTRRRRRAYWRQWRLEQHMNLEDWRLLPHSDYWTYSPEEIREREKKEIERLKKKIEESFPD